MKEITIEPPIHEFVRRDVQGNYRGESIKLRRADIQVSNMFLKKIHLIDVTVCSIKEPRNSGEIGITLANGETRKLKHYNEFCTFPSQVTLLPFAIDTYGGWGKSFDKYLKEVCSETAGGKKNNAYSRLLWEAKCSIQIAHARAVSRNIRNALHACIPHSERNSFITGLKSRVDDIDESFYATIDEMYDAYE